MHTAPASALLCACACIFAGCLAPSYAEAQRQSWGALGQHFSPSFLLPIGPLTQAVRLPRICTVRWIDEHVVECIEVFSCVAKFMCSAIALLSRGNNTFCGESQLLCSRMNVLMLHTHCKHMHRCVVLRVPRTARGATGQWRTAARSARLG